MLWPFSSSEEHESCRRWLTDAAAAGDAIGLCELVEAALLRIPTPPGWPWRRWRIPSDFGRTIFPGSINETKSAFAGNYEILWEDTSPEGVAWVELQNSLAGSPWPHRQHPGCGRHRPLPLPHRHRFHGADFPRFGGTAGSVGTEIRHGDPGRSPTRPSAGAVWVKKRMNPTMRITRQTSLSE